MARDFAKFIATPGNCYEDCVHLLLYWFDEDAEVLLCHGEPTLTADTPTAPAGTKYGHAWLETPMEVPGLARCWDLAECWDHLHLDSPCPSALYYHAGNIEEVAVERYTREEASRWMVRFEHYGPW